MSELDDVTRELERKLAANMRRVVARVEQQLFFPQPERRPLPPNVIEISAVCGSIRVLMVDEVGPHYGIRLQLVECPFPDMDRYVVTAKYVVPDGYAVCSDDDSPETFAVRSMVRRALLAFHLGTDLSKLRIRLLVDGIQYEVNGAAPENMQPVKALPGPVALLPQAEC